MAPASPSPGHLFERQTPNRKDVQPAEDLAADSSKRKLRAWQLVPLLENEEDRRLGTVVVDFNESFMSYLFGPQAHQRYFRAIRRHRFIAKTVLLTYNLAIGALTVALVVGEATGTYLSAFAALGILPGSVQLLLSINPKLLQKSAQSAQFWITHLLLLALWTTVGMTFGGIRGTFLCSAGLLLAVTGGPLMDCNHYRARQSSGSFWGYLFATLLYIMLAASISMKVFRGGRVLRWTVGSRQLTGEDLVVNCAGTAIFFLIPYLIATSRISILQRRKAFERWGSSGRVTLKTAPSSQTLPPREERTEEKRAMLTRKIFCSSMQWPLTLEIADDASVVDTSKGSCCSVPPALSFAVGGIGQPHGTTRVQVPARRDVQTALKEQQEGGAGGEGEVQMDAIVGLTLERPTRTRRLLHPREDLFSFCNNRFIALGSVLFKRLTDWLRRKNSQSEGKAHAKPKKIHVEAPPSAAVGQGSTAAPAVETDGPRRKADKVETREPFEGWLIVLVRVLIFYGAACMIPAGYIIGNRRKTMSHESLTSLSIVIGVTTLLWNLAAFVYLSRVWNVQLLRLVLRSSFDFWFLTFQAFMLFFSYCDAFEYDERCLILLSWCLLYVACLFSDCILPVLPEEEEDGSVRRHCEKAITKRFQGLGLMLPLLAIQCAFLYDLTFGRGSDYLRSRTVLQITKHREEGVVETIQEEGKEGSRSLGAATVLDFSVDSFIVARQVSIILFSLPLLHHLLAQSLSMTPSLWGDALEAAHHKQREVRVTSGADHLWKRKCLPATPSTALQWTGRRRDRELFFLTTRVSYEIPVRKPP